MNFIPLHCLPNFQYYNGADTVLLQYCWVIIRNGRNIFHCVVDNIMCVSGLPFGMESGSVDFPQSYFLFLGFRNLAVLRLLSYFLFLKFRNSDVSFRNSETNGLVIESRSKMKMFITAFVF